jgi:hypothetical protein
MLKCVDFCAHSDTICADIVYRACIYRARIYLLVCIYVVLYMSCFICRDLYVLYVVIYMLYTS